MTLKKPRFAAPSFGTLGRSLTRGLLPVLLLLGAAAVLPFAGCTPDEEQPPTITEEWPQLDPNSKVATIDADLNVTPETINLSKGAGEFMQWKNDSGEDVRITFTGAPVGIVVPAGRVSYVFQVNPRATEGSYPYVLEKPSGLTSPGTPDVNVGP